MGILRGVGKVLKPLVDVRLWMGYDGVKSSGIYVIDIIKRLFRITHPATDLPDNNKFDEMVRRLGISEAELTARAKAYKLQSVIYVAVGVIIFFYTVYLFAQGLLLSSLISFLIACLVWVYAFRTHFWAFQIQRHEVDCTIKAWFHSLFKRADKHD